MEKKKSGLALTGLILGIIGISLSFIPILNNASFFLGILAIIFGIIPIIKKVSKGKAIAAIVLGFLSIVITLSLQSSWSNSLDEAVKELDSSSSENIEKVQKNADINIGTFETKTTEYGYNETKLVVKITNKSNEKKSFNIEIEAIDKNGDRIDTAYVYASNLNPSQSQDFEIFTYVSDDNLVAMQSATFKIISASMY